MGYIKNECLLQIGTHQLFVAGEFNIKFFTPLFPMIRVQFLFSFSNA